MTNFDESIQIFVPLKVRKQNGRPKIMPPATYLPSEDRTQDPHILRAIGRAWGWRRRMEAGEFNTVTDLAKAVGLPPFAPHSFRKTLGLLANEHCKTPEQFKAWSMNLGHENIATTLSAYCPVSSSRQGALIRGMG